MAHRVFKPEPDRDLYLVWTTVADGPVWAGTRQEVTEEYLRGDYAPNQGEEYIEGAINARFQRVDIMGTTDLRRRVPIWDDEGAGLIYARPDGSGMAWLPYTNLLAFTEEFKAAHEAATEDGWTFTPSAHLLEVLED